MSRPFTSQPSAPLASDMQAAILRYLAVDPRVAWARRCNVGAQRIVGTDSKGRPTRRFIRDAFPGCSNLLGQLVTGHLLAVECQCADEDASDDQAAFLADVDAAGGLAILARSIDDVRAQLDAFCGETTANVQAMRETAITPEFHHPRWLRG